MIDAPRSPREFLSALTLNNLSESYMDAIKKSVDNDEVDPQNLGIEQMMLSHLRRHCPGIHDYIDFIAEVGEVQGMDRQAVTAMLSGALIMARSITLAAETDSLPPVQ